MHFAYVMNELTSINCNAVYKHFDVDVFHDAYMYSDVYVLCPKLIYFKVSINLTSKRAHW